MDYYLKECSSVLIGAININGFAGFFGTPASCWQNILVK